VARSAHPEYRLKNNGAVIAAGNSDVKDRVADGRAGRHPLARRSYSTNDA
jgi:hypothetical protein